MFSKILIANRGEIAVRIIRACKEMGISTVAVYSEADKHSLHCALADKSVCIGGTYSSESYLNMENIITAAIATGAEAIHPGYGFLAENPEFAKLCKSNGLVFIGPGAEVILKMGNKDNARQIMQNAGVPVIPGSGLLSNIKAAEKAAERIGLPVLLKARAGGGGKGIRLVNSKDELAAAYSAASEEAAKAFGDGGLYMEKYLYPVKHVEIQLLADEKGRVICLGERECSIQKNNQKLVEEAPSASLSCEVRKKMIDAAVKAAHAAEYVNAGTVEFLLTKDDKFYFMEMNTRLQVEHGVTEQISRIDIVKWQIRIAAGVELDIKQEDIQIQGAAIECRINALGCGKIKFLHVPGGPWVRFDTALYQDSEITPYYDSLLGKMIVYANTREEAIRKMRAALCELVITGVPTNAELQTEIIGNDKFVKGEYYTDFMRDKGEDSL